MPLQYPPAGMRQTQRTSGPANLFDILQFRRKRRLEDEALQGGREQDLLAQELTKAKIGELGRRPHTKLRPIKGKKNWLLLDPTTGRIIDTGEPISQTSLFGDNIVDKINKAVGKAGTEETPAPKTDTQGGWFDFLGDWFGKAAPGADGSLEAALSEPQRPQKNLPEGHWMRRAQRMRRQGKMAATSRKSSKPAKYPDAVWNEEHGMWTVIRNGRLKGIK